MVDEVTVLKVKEILGKGGNCGDVLEQADRLLGNYEIAVISDEDAWDPCYGDIVALYSNNGDTYEATVLYDVKEGEFLFTSWGDWLESYEHEKELATKDES